MFQCSTHHPDQNFYDLLSQEYNIIDLFESKQFETNNFIRCFEECVLPTKKQIYNPEDRYILTLFDTCYYANTLNLFFYNFIRLWHHYDIPSYTLILYTNHFGIEKEFKSYFTRLHPADQPMVIETFFNPGNYRNPEINTTYFNTDNIDYHILGILSGAKRVHRQVLFDFLYKNCKNNSALSYNYEYRLQKNKSIK